MTIAHTNQAAWDTRQKYYETLGLCLQLIMEARVSKNTYAWWSILDGILSQYGPAFKNKEIVKEARKELELINNVLHPSEEDGLTVNERSSQALDLLRLLEPKIMDQLYGCGLLSPRRVNPIAAAGEGLA